MTARYSIMVCEHGSNHETELLQVNSNPDAIVAGLRAKMLTIRRSIFDGGKRQTRIPKYIFVRVIDHGAV
jgi:hypothetical protein